MTSMNSYVIDTYAWVEYLLGSRVGRTAKEFIEAGDSSTPSVVLAELARWYLREIEAGRRTNNEMREHLEYVGNITSIVPLDAILARESGELDFLMKKRARGWPLADSIIYATAKARDAKVVTGDPHFKGLEEVEFLG
jgi:predicted nucleic acid-binding protein